MMEGGKKRRKFSISSLPFDCWCHVVLFLEDKNDFFSLVEAVRNLREYISRIYPHCTADIPFKTHKLPDENHGYVSKLYYKLCSESSDGFDVVNSLRTSTLDWLFSRFSALFKNLLKLRLHIYNEINDKKSFKSWNLPNMSLKKLQTPLLIKYMDILVTESNLHVDILFPRLSFLVVREYRRHNIPPKKLSINFSKMPRIDGLSVFGFVLKTPLKLVSHRLEKLTVSGEMFSHDLCDMPKLEMLCINALSVGWIERFENFNNLKTIEIVQYWAILPNIFNDFNFPDGYVKSEVKMKFEIQDLPSLEALRVGFKGQEFKQKWHERTIIRDRPLVVSNCPKLREIQVLDIGFGVVAKNCNNLNKIYGRDCELIDSTAPLQLTKIEELLLFKVRMTESSRICKCVEKFRNMVKIRIEGSNVGFSDVTNTKVRVVGFEHLVCFIIENFPFIIVEEAADCPKLEYLISPFIKKPKLSNLPKLRDLIMTFLDRGEISLDIFDEVAKFQKNKNLRFSLEQAYLKNKPLPLDKICGIEKMCFHIVDSVVIDGENITKLKNVFGWVENRVQLLNHPVLESAEFGGMLREGGLFEVKNCPALKTIEICHDLFPPNFEKDESLSKELKIDIRGCPNLHRMKLGFFWTMRKKYNFVLDSTNVKVLDILVREMAGWQQEKDSVGPFLVSAARFPNLEQLRIVFGSFMNLPKEGKEKQELDEYFEVDIPPLLSLEGLKKLRAVEFIGAVFPPKQRPIVFSSIYDCVEVDVSFMSLKGCKLHEFCVM